MVICEERRQSWVYVVRIVDHSLCSIKTYDIRTRKYKGEVKSAVEKLAFDFKPEQNEACLQSTSLSQRKHDVLL